MRGSLACPKNNNMANDSDQLDCPLQELSLLGKAQLLNKLLQSIYLIFIFSLLFANVKFRASVKIPVIKRSKQKDKLNHRLVLTTEILLSTSAKGFTHHRRCKREKNYFPLNKCMLRLSSI